MGLGQLSNSGSKCLAIVFCEATNVFFLEYIVGLTDGKRGTSFISSSALVRFIGSPVQIDPAKLLK